MTIMTVAVAVFCLVVTPSIVGALANRLGLNSGTAGKRMAETALLIFIIVAVLLAQVWSLVIIVRDANQMRAQRRALTRYGRVDGVSGLDEMTADHV